MKPVSGNHKNSDLVNVSVDTSAAQRETSVIVVSDKKRLLFKNLSGVKSRKNRVVYLALAIASICAAVWLGVKIFGWQRSNDQNKTPVVKPELVKPEIEWSKVYQFEPEAKQ